VYEDRGLRREQLDRTAGPIIQEALKVMGLSGKEATRLSQERVQDRDNDTDPGRDPGIMAETHTLANHHGAVLPAVDLHSRVASDMTPVDWQKKSFDQRAAVIEALASIQKRLNSLGPWALQ
jgi:hypothetical protein